MRLFELAKELKLTSKELMALCAKLHLKAPSHMAVLDEKSVAKLRQGAKPVKPKAPLKAVRTAPPPKSAKLPVAPAPAPPRVVVPPVSRPAAAPVPKHPAPIKPVFPTAPKALPPAPRGYPAPPPRTWPPPAPAKPPPAQAAPPQKPAPVPIGEQKPSAALTQEPAELKPLQLKVPLTVKELADKLAISPSDVIKRLLGMKIMMTINQLLSEETVRALLKLYGYEYQKVPSLVEQLDTAHEQEDPAKLKPRAPVVTLMGHVDHGKTSLLDAVRKSKVVEGEAGGITQHIGAYRVSSPKGTITFLDTPGHEAFTAMRARGAHVTDIVILVVAVDDGVMPQTVEAIDHAKAAEATIVVALNKIDKPGANPDRVKKQLLELGLNPEDWGGKTIVVPVSAKTGAGIDQMLDMILLEAELLELKANPAASGRGIVLEGKLSKGGGPIAHILVQSGTLRVGDVVVSGATYGRVRAMLDERGHRLDEAGPSTPVELLGLNGVPRAGDTFLIVPDEKGAREIALQRQEESRGARAPMRRVVSLEEFHRQLEAGRVKSLNLILKADVQGSVEAIRDSLLKITSEEVNLKILHAGVGDVTEPDVLLAEASNAVVIGFHVEMTEEAARLAKEEQVDVRLYRIIYEAVADIRAALEGLLEPRTVEQVVGRAKVLQVFKVSKSGTIAGCQVLKGKVLRGALGKVIRGEKPLAQGKIHSLKRFKDDVREVGEGLQCGIGIAGCEDFQPEDIIEVVELQQVAGKL